MEECNERFLGDDCMAFGWFGQRAKPKRKTTAQQQYIYWGIKVYPLYSRVGGWFLRDNNLNVVLFSTKEQAENFLRGFNYSEIGMRGAEVEEYDKRVYR